MAEKGDVPKVQAFVAQARANSIPGEQRIQSAIDALKKPGYRVSWARAARAGVSPGAR